MKCNGIAWYLQKWKKWKYLQKWKIKKNEGSKKISCSKTLSLGEVIMYLGHVEYKLPLHLQN